jgi:hypothetical protein
LRKEDLPTIVVTKPNSQQKTLSYPAGFGEIFIKKGDKSETLKGLALKEKIFENGNYAVEVITEKKSVKQTFTLETAKETMEYQSCGCSGMYAFTKTITIELKDD